ncbi:transposase [bacterium]|nr:transposase [bacterium]
MKIPNEILSIDPDNLNLDDKAKGLFILMLNYIEEMAQVILYQQNEIQKLKDEINRLKGQKGKPIISPNVPKKENDVFSPQKVSKKWKKRSKKDRIKIDRTEYRKVDRSTLPQDAKFKGYRQVTVQNIKLETDNVMFMIERFYSPSHNKTFEAKLPDWVDGEFGSDLKAFVHLQYYPCRVPEKKIWKILQEAGIVISQGHISNILTKNKKEKFSKEKDTIFEVGMKSSEYFHIDETGARHEGIRHYAHVICTALFSVFFITRRKNKETVKWILGIDSDEEFDKIMMSDDAKQFMFIAVLHALCWIHEIRHYIKMSPFITWHRQKLHEFLSEILKFYYCLKEYRDRPSEDQKAVLENQFDTLFSTKTGYGELDERIALTKKKKERLLVVLDHPEIPLHNNPAEIALREFVIKKKVSYGTKSEDGRIAWENMMTLLDTCRKNDVSFFEYVKDIFSGQYDMPRLADLIAQKASS